MSAARPSRPPASLPLPFERELIGSTWGHEATARAIPAASPSEARTLRAKAVPRTLNAQRGGARRLGALALDNACRNRGISSARLAAALGLTKGSDKEGDEARSGAIPITAGEMMLLPELDVALDVFLELLLHRLGREPAGASERALRSAFHVQALRELLAEPSPSIR